MSLKLALETLKNLGLTDMDARVYVYLAKKGPREENDLAVGLNLTRNQLGFSLDSLVTRGMVSTIPESPTKYFATPLEKVLHEFMKTTEEQAKALQESKKELLATWRYAIEKDSSNS